MSSTPASAVKTSGRTRPCVSEISPMTRRSPALIRLLRRCPPARRQRVRDVEVIEHARDHEVDEIVDRRGPVIEARSRGHHDCAGARHAQHVLEMNRAEWRFTRHENELPSLLECDVGRALDERSRRARRRSPTTVPIEHGQITMPAFSADPDAGAAPRSASSKVVTNRSHAAPPTRCAQRLDGIDVGLGVAAAATHVPRRSAARTDSPRSSDSSRRTAYGAPDAPVIAIDERRSVTARTEARAYSATAVVDRVARQARRGRTRC